MQTSLTGWVLITGEQKGLEPLWSISTLWSLGSPSRLAAPPVESETVSAQPTWATADANCVPKEVFLKLGSLCCVFPK